MKIGYVLKTKEDFKPLFRKGDLFRIVKINEDENLMPIEAIRLKDREVYGFEVGELK